ncbi:cupin domain-containing protein [Tsukamurella tyrosinosolvens]|uniref:cupin domain-containing protein n=1 Tax=Tsukamurella tyrosinosolvens TaxID=57704 RepID=UPI00147717FB|nr:cupin domain-containing protein [Tsukamurella tyrosinosolvens]
MTSKVSATNVADQHTFSYYGAAASVKLSSEQTSDRFYMISSTIRPGIAPPLHVHHFEDEVYVVLRGTVRYFHGADWLDECETVDVSAGGSVWLPRGIPHTWDTVTSESDILLITNNGNFERFTNKIVDLELGNVRHDNDIAYLYREHGMEVLGPAPDLHGVGGSR